jgi:hypothetical protein
MTEKVLSSTLTWVSIRRETRKALICKEAGSRGGAMRTETPKRLGSKQLTHEGGGSDVGPSGPRLRRHTAPR